MRLSSFSRGLINQQPCAPAGRVAGERPGSRSKILKAHSPLSRTIVAAISLQRRLPSSGIGISRVTKDAISRLMLEQRHLLCAWELACIYGRCSESIVDV